MKNNITSISVYLDRRDHVEDPETEEQAASFRKWIAFKIWHKREMDLQDDAMRRRRRRGRQFQRFGSLARRSRQSSRQ